MKVAITSDWHIRGDKPRCRKDDFFRTQMRKLEFIRRTFIEHNCMWMVHTGDLTEHSPYPRFDWRCFNSLLNLPLPSMMVIPGQHDFYFRGSVEKTPLYALDAAGRGSIIVMSMGQLVFDDVLYFGAQYGTSLDDIHPDIQNSVKCSILMLHTLVSDTDRWNGHANFLTPKYLLDRFPQFDLIATGDNHHGFIYSEGYRHVVNAGSLTRQAIDQADHQPFIAVYDTETKEVKRINIPIEPFEEVAMLDEKKRDDAKKEEMEAFIQSLDNKESSVPDVLVQLRKVMESTDGDVREVLEEAISKLGEKK